MTTRKRQDETQTVDPTQEIIDDLRAEVSRLSGKTEDLQIRQNSMPDLEKIEERISKLEEAQLEILEKIRKIEDDLPPPDPIVYYKKGKNLFSKDDYAGAVQFLTKYIESTKSKKGKTAQEAHFFIGESQYKQKNFKKAILAYDSVLRKYKHIRFQAKSLYGIGLCFDSLGKPKEADDFYKELVQKYPKSKQARLAKSKLKKSKK